MHMARRARSLLVALAASASLAAAWLTLAPVREADAKTSFDSPYTLDQTYNAALRLVRVDMGLKITERDPAAAYVIFDYKSPESGPKSGAGSIEMLTAPRGVKVVVQLSQMPRYHEQVLVDALQRKLRAEYGEPPRRPSGDAPDAGPPTGFEDDAGAD